jgi:two-component system response regulator YesN
MNIVLIDDEQVVLNGLAKMIGAIDSTWRIFGTYSDPIEALNNCNWDLVDVVLVDISMNEMDGISLVRALRENRFETLVIYVTAHANFNYAQQGAHLDMLDYLLKPVSRERLVDSLKRAQRQTELKKLEKQTPQYIEDNLQTLQEHFLGDLIFEEHDYDSGEIVDKSQELGLEAKSFLIALIKSEEQRSKIMTLMNSVLGAEAKYFLFGQTTFFTLIVVDDENSGQESLPDFKDSELHLQLWTSKERATLCTLSSQFQTLLSQSKRNIPERPVERRDTLLPNREHLCSNIKYVVEYIETHYADTLTLGKMAQIVYLHPAYLSNIFKKQTGYTFIDYLNEVRILNAKRLLADPINKIYWIVEQVGFSNQRYFNAVFKKSTGLTPAQYRQSVIL